MTPQAATEITLSSNIRWGKFAIVLPFDLTKPSKSKNTTFKIQ